MSLLGDIPGDPDVRTLTYASALRSYIGARKPGGTGEAGGSESIEPTPPVRDISLETRRRAKSSSAR